MGKVELAQALTYWQVVLGLKDWDLRVRLARQHEMADGTRTAEVTWRLTHRQGSVLILDPVDYRDDVMGLPQDPEEDLVHELLHLVLTAWAPERDSPEHMAQEQAINALSKALVSLRRGLFMGSFPGERKEV